MHEIYQLVIHILRHKIKYSEAETGKLHNRPECDCCAAFSISIIIYKQISGFLLFSEIFL